MARTIENILRLNTEIGMKYMNSKLPKFISIRIYNKNKNKLCKLVDNIKNGVLSYDLLAEYINILYDNGEFGAQNHYDDNFYCTNIIREQLSERVIVANFDFNVTDPLDNSKCIKGLKGSVEATVNQKTSDVYMTYIMTCNGRNLIKLSEITKRFSEVDTVNYSDLISLSFPNTSEDKALYLKNQFILSINKDIKRFIKNRIELKESVNI